MILSIAAPRVPRSPDGKSHWSVAGFPDMQFQQPGQRSQNILTAGASKAVSEMPSILSPACVTTAPSHVEVQFCQAWRPTRTMGCRLESGRQASATDKCLLPPLVELSKPIPNFSFGGYQHEVACKEQCPQLITSWSSSRTYLTTDSKQNYKAKSIARNPQCICT